MKSKKFFLFVLLTIIIQVVFTSKFNLINTQFPFLDGVPITSAFQLEYKYLLNWYLPIVSISFYFSGYLSKLVEAQSIVFFIRNYSKSQWIIKQFLSMVLFLFTFIVFQSLLFALTTPDNLVFSFGNLSKSFLIYFLTLVTLFSMQQLLELYIKPEIAHLTINIYIVLSVLFAGEIYQNSTFFSYFLLPNYGMSFKNGLSQVPEFKIYSVNYFNAMIILVVIELIVIGLSVRRIKNMDLM
ncbi:DUF2705 family protein [Paraliobacillus sp. JSM ZJ581]|uniref:DUF2705 family protein n=1 Tax=Paraliobacillus sp. JSM ZJ581 TaxID=3342118 RepID=UPI0035A84259